MKLIWDDMIKQKAYQEVLNSTSEVLQSNPIDPEALVCRGKANLCQRSYQRSYQDFLLLSKTNKISPKLARKVREVLKFCHRILAFEENFQKNCQASKTFPENWYTETLLRQLPKNLQYKEYSECLKSLQSAKAYIIGPEKEVPL